MLDFGLATSGRPRPRFAGARLADRYGRSEPATGCIVGTAAYMSPEQARGQSVDKRTDIWAFGCVLYEMLSGRRAFDGETVTDTLAAIIDREPDWTALPAAVPASVRHLLRRCLDKDPKRRLRDIGDARVGARGLAQAQHTGQPGPDPRVYSARSPIRALGRRWSRTSGRGGCVSDGAVHRLPL